VTDDVTESKQRVPPMNMLCFFPWVTVAEPIDCVDFELVPYRRHAATDEDRRPEHATLDGILAPYEEMSGGPVASATLLRHGACGLTDALSGDQRAEVFLFSELVAFAALAKREFFGFGNRYCNRHTFAFYVQSFDGAADGAAIDARRRDGNTRTRVTKNAYRVLRPPHVSPQFDAVRLDIPLLRALLAARNDDGWNDLHEAIFWFNLANTDSDQHSPDGELIMLSNALQRLLRCKSSKEKELADAFASAHEWRAGLDLSQFQHVTTHMTEPGLTFHYTWIRDLYRSRGELAHGRRQTNRRFIWSTDLHLLLGAFVFPRLAKAVLAKRGLYTLTPDDRSELAAFEHLLACPDLLPTNRKDGDPFPWNEILRCARRGALCRKTQDDLETKDRDNS